MSAESPGQKSGFRSFVSNALRPKKSRQTLRKGSIGSRSTSDLRMPRPSADEPPPMPSLAPLQAHRLKYKEAHSQLDTQLGYGPSYIDNRNRPPGEADIAKLPSRLWVRIASYLSPADVASLTISSKTLYRHLGPRFLMVLDTPNNRDHRLEFLVRLDESFPHHLLCYPCGKYHRRTQAGAERLRPAHVLNPLFVCPEATNILNPQPRHRITHGRLIPYSFVQLVLRAHQFGPHYGVPVSSMGRRWSRDEWSHHTRFHVHAGRLLMRVTSQTFADPGLPASAQRMLLFSREDYWPYFSACAHWRDGELMQACKCALGHIPVPRDTGGLQGIEHRVKDRLAGQKFDPNALTRLCGFCRPMRRCPECPTEYLIEVKLAEDKSDPRGSVFRHTLVVTRWTDLGDGKSPRGFEWGGSYSKRGIASIFEAAFTADTLPGQRVISLNPKGKKLGEDGNEWY
ncbi:hypothetical protein N7470_000199 [Penicillium chermesinum]|nr:hypothetical protein N7470_000199 [Penicillium chermesinum]